MSLACRLLRAAVALGLLWGTPAAEAETGTLCADRGLVVEKLAERFGETLRSLGLDHDDGLVEIYTSEATGSWTILMTRPDGTACLLAAGQLWEQDATPLRKAGSPA